MKEGRSVEEKKKSHDYADDYRPNDFASILAVSIWLGAVGAVFLFVCSIVFVPSQKYRMFASALFLLGAILPLPKNDSEHLLGYKIGDWIMANASRYFGLRVHCEDVAAIKSIKLKKESGCIVALEPHDILPYTIFAFNK